VGADVGTRSAAEVSALIVGSKLGVVFGRVPAIMPFSGATRVSGADAKREVIAGMGLATFDS
jgi:hypothetical protein